MIQITPQMRVLVAVEAVDGRKGIDSLAALCRARLQADPFSGPGRRRGRRTAGSRRQTRALARHGTTEERRRQRGRDRPADCLAAAYRLDPRSGGEDGKPRQ